MAGEGESKSTRIFAVYSGVTAPLAFAACNGLIIAAALMALVAAAGWDWCVIRYQIPQI